MTPKGSPKGTKRDHFGNIFGTKAPRNPKNVFSQNNTKTDAKTLFLKARGHQFLSKGLFERSFFACRKKVPKSMPKNHEKEAQWEPKSTTNAPKRRPKHKPKTRATKRHQKHKKINLYCSFCAPE